jgi:hypothetical protein
MALLFSGMAWAAAPTITLYTPTLTDQQCTSKYGTTCMMDDFRPEFTCNMDIITSNYIYLDLCGYRVTPSSVPVTSCEQYDYSTSTWVSSYMAWKGIGPRATMLRTSGGDTAQIRVRCTNADGTTDVTSASWKIKPYHTPPVTGDWSIADPYIVPSQYPVAQADLQGVQPYTNEVVRLDQTLTTRGNIYQCQQRSWYKDAGVFYSYNESGWVTVDTSNAVNGAMQYKFYPHEGTRTGWHKFGIACRSSRYSTDGSGNWVASSEIEKTKQVEYLAVPTTPTINSATYTPTPTSTGPKVHTVSLNLSTSNAVACYVNDRAGVRWATSIPVNGVSTLAAGHRITKNSEIICGSTRNAVTAEHTTGTNVFQWFAPVTPSVPTLRSTAGDFTWSGTVNVDTTIRRDVDVAPYTGLDGDTVCTAGGSVGEGGGWTGTKSMSTSGTNESVTQRYPGTYNYSISCVTPDGTEEKDKVSVYYADPSGSTSFYMYGSASGYESVMANQDDGSVSMTVPVNTSVNLSWISNGASTCTASGTWSGTKTAPNNENVTSATAGVKNYVLSCTHNSKLVERRVRVTFE